MTKMLWWGIRLSLSIMHIDRNLECTQSRSSDVIQMMLLSSTWTDGDVGCIPTAAAAVVTGPFAEAVVVAACLLLGGDEPNGVP